MTWDIQFTRSARKDLARIPPRDVEYILNAIPTLENGPPYPSDVLKLKGRPNEWRLRVGSWRVIFMPDARSQTIEILNILPRGRAYR
jgi:mRNA interferase RelE/StbE